MDTNGFGNGAEAAERLRDLTCVRIASPPATPEALERAGVEGELERVRHEAQTFRQRYQELMDFARDGYLVTDPQGVIVEANATAAFLLGGRRDFLPGKPLAFFVAEGDRRTFYRRLLALGRKAGDADCWEATFRPLTGRLLHVILTVAAIRNELDRPTGFRWLLRDVTRHRRTEHALEVERDFTDRLMDEAPTVVLVLDAAGRVVRSNPFLQTVSGYGEGDVRGRDWCMLVPEHERAAARQMLRWAAAGPSGRATVRGLLARDGRLRAVVWSAVHLAGSPETFLLLGHDITDLEEAQQQALQAERLAALGQVMAGLAHEGRNALQRGQASLERLSWRLADHAEALDLLARTQRALDDLRRLFEDVRVCAGPLPLERRPCDLAVVWREAWDKVTALAPGRDAGLEEETAGADLACRADPFRLGQVFRNIFENSFAACPGPVRVRIACREMEASRERQRPEAGSDPRAALQVSVRDNGPGLRPEQRGRLFEPFYTTKAQGTGLGMAIARRIAEAHGGQIAVGDSGPGLELIITLPRGEP